MHQTRRKHTLQTADLPECRCFRFKGHALTAYGRTRSPSRMAVAVCCGSEPPPYPVERNWKMNCFRMHVHFTLPLRPWASTQFLSFIFRLIPIRLALTTSSLMLFKPCLEISTFLPLATTVVEMVLLLLQATDTSKLSTDRSQARQPRNSREGPPHNHEMAIRPSQRLQNILGEH